MTSEQPVRFAVLRNYPLRLWMRHQEHFDGVLREFQLLLAGRDQGLSEDTPGRLLELADTMTSRFGAVVDRLYAERHAALERGEVAMDSKVPLVDGAREFLLSARDVMKEVDGFCEKGDLLSLATPPEMRAFREWSIDQLLSQYDGGEPVAWDGPME